MSIAGSCCAAQGCLCVLCPSSNTHGHTTLPVEVSEKRLISKSSVVSTIWRWQVHSRKVLSFDLVWLKLSDLARLPKADSVLGQGWLFFFWDITVWLGSIPRNSCPCQPVSQRLFCFLPCLPGVISGVKDWMVRVKVRIFDESGQIQHQWVLFRVINEYQDPYRILYWL